MVYSIILLTTTYQENAFFKNAAAEGLALWSPATCQRNLARC